MSVSLELYQTSIDKHDPNVFKELAHAAIVASGRVDVSAKLIDISVACVDEDEMRRVNKLLRQRDSVTDVLSVGEYSDEKDISTEFHDEIFLGEIILCYNYIAQCAQEIGGDVQREFYTAFVHGVLHLLGFRHGRKMFALQEEISGNYLPKHGTI